MIKHRLSILAITLIYILTFASPVSANREEEFSVNNIYWYSPNEQLNVCNPGSSIFDGDKDLKPSSPSEAQLIITQFLASTPLRSNNNQTLNNVQIAALLGNIQQESSFNPEAGGSGSHRGIVQWDSGRYSQIAEPRTSIANQLEFLKSELESSYYAAALGNFWTINSGDRIEEATFLIARNYEVAIKNGGGSTSWTNNDDAANYLQDWSNRRKYALEIYMSLGGEVQTNIVCGGLTVGGLNRERAEALVKEYNETPLAGNEWMFAGSSLGGSPTFHYNCTTFSSWFVHVYTNSKYNMGNGIQVVANMIAANPNMGYGPDPRPYAIFSGNSVSGNSAGHTGVVLAVYDDGTMLIAEAGWNSYNGRVKIMNLSEAQRLNYHYAYPEMKGGL